MSENSHRKLQKRKNHYKIRISVNRKLEVAICDFKWGRKKEAAFLFTEQGVAMLYGLLNSERAIDVNIQIRRIFTKIRQALIDNTELRLAIEEIRQKTNNNTKNSELVFQYLYELLDNKENKE